MPKWSYIGRGTYNDVYINQDRTMVLKIKKTHSFGQLPATDLPERSVRLWNEFNGDKFQGRKAELHSTEIDDPTHNRQGRYHGWVCPYVEGRQASDEEISNALIEIFNKTGRIVVDAPSPKNFITTPSGEVVCVDIGYALQAQLQEEREITGNSIRRECLKMIAKAENNPTYQPSSTALRSAP